MKKETLMDILRNINDEDKLLRIYQYYKEQKEEIERAKSRQAKLNKLVDSISSGFALSI